MFQFGNVPALARWVKRRVDSSGACSSARFPRSLQLDRNSVRSTRSMRSPAATLRRRGFDNSNLLNSAASSARIAQGRRFKQYRQAASGSARGDWRFFGVADHRPIERRQSRRDEIDGTQTRVQFQCLRWPMLSGIRPSAGRYRRWRKPMVHGW
jgi:hypothetical protein